MHGATAFHDLLASPQAVGTFILREGDYRGQLGESVEGMPDCKGERPQALDELAGSSGNNSKKADLRMILGYIFSTC
jgi:hypothetical protein